jgi:hypothetical protein
MRLFEQFCCLRQEHALEVAIFSFKISSKTGHRPILSFSMSKLKALTPVNGK